MFAHVAWSSKTVIEFVSVDTDVFSILLLNHQKYDHEQIITKSSENCGILDMTKLMEEMNDDTNTKLARIRKNGVSTPLFLALSILSLEMTFCTVHEALVLHGLSNHVYITQHICFIQKQAYSTSAMQRTNRKGLT
jgi:hypothetical protein